MSYTVYVYSKCSTCQKAIHFLEQQKIAFTRKEITVTPPSIAELERMLKYMHGDVKKLFNTSGIMYREMELSKKIPDMPLQEALKLLHSNGMLVKRPFLLSNDGRDKGLVGFREAEWAIL